MKSLDMTFIDVQCVAKLHGSEWERVEDSEDKEHDSEKGNEENKGKEKQKVYAARAMKKAERLAEIRRKYEQWKEGRSERYTARKMVVRAARERGSIAGDQYLRQEPRGHS